MPRPCFAPRALIVVVLSAVVASLLAVGAPVASAADLSQFNAGNIISDENFYNSNALSPQDTAAFVRAKGAGCVANGGPPCLKDYRQSTPNRDGDALCPGGYSGRTMEPASDIVWKVAQGCGINPAVLLVMLQKEQGLVTSRAPYQSNYDSAMGQGCPDTAACDAYYTGFFNQVYGAAAQLQRYRLDPTSYGYRAGLVNNILYNPNQACGSSQVRIANQATAGLYNFTPYRPNAAALAAGYGTGDGCSAYGNRNFYNYYNDWFGPTVRPNAAPVGSLDSVDWAAKDASTGTIAVRGWAMDPDTASSIQVHVYIDGQGTPLVANVARPDVNAARGTSGSYGFAASLPTSNALHQVCVYAIDSAYGDNTTLGCRTVGNHPPVGYADSVTWNPSFSGPGSISVRGWALDPDDPGASSGVALYVDNQGIPGTAGLSRPDVNAALGVPGQHGYLTTLGSGPGRHSVCLYATDTAGGPPTALTCGLVIANAAPIGYLDSVSVAGGVLTTRGWSVDPDTSAPIKVAVYVDGAGVAVVQADGSRPDVSTAFPGAGDQHGFRATSPIAPGQHVVCTYGTDTAAGDNTTLGCLSFTA